MSRIFMLTRGSMAHPSFHVNRRVPCGPVCLANWVSHAKPASSTFFPVRKHNGKACRVFQEFKSLYLWTMVFIQRLTLTSVPVNRSQGAALRDHRRPSTGAAASDSGRSGTRQRGAGFPAKPPLIRCSRPFRTRLALSHRLCETLAPLSEGPPATRFGVQVPVSGGRGFLLWVP